MLAQIHGVGSRNQEACAERDPGSKRRAGVFAFRDRPDVADQARGGMPRPWLKLTGSVPSLTGIDRC